VFTNNNSETIPYNKGYATPKKREQRSKRQRRRSQDAPHDIILPKQQDTLKQRTKTGRGLKDGDRRGGTRNM
jgi:hypothetical protein